jgi:hypothetical protein
LMGDRHTPKGARLVAGFMSCTVATGFVPPYVPFVGATISFDGELPIEHATVAP